MAKAVQAGGFQGRIDEFGNPVAEPVDQHVVKAVGILVKQRFDKGAGCGFSAFRATDETQLQRRAKPVRRVNAQRVLPGHDGLRHVAGMFVQFSQPEPASGPVRPDPHGVFKEIGRSGEIAALGEGFGIGGPAIDYQVA